MYVDVEIDLDVRPKTVMIPAVAIQSGQKGPFVFVAKDDQTAEMRKIELAGIEGDRAALASGVNDGRAGHRRGADAPGRRRARRRGGTRTAASRRAAGARTPKSAADGGARPMNISEFCIRHPVATTLMSAALVVGGMFAYLFLPVAALPRTEFPVINVSASLPGASPDTMANAVATPLIKQFSTICRHRHHQRDQRAGLDLDRHPVQSQPRHRQRRGRRAVGDRARAAAAADRDDRAAELSQGQPGRRADPDPGAEQRYRAAAGDGRLRPAGDLAGAVDDRRRRAGAGLRQPEIRGPGATRTRMRSRPAASASTRSRRRSRRPTPTRRSARCETHSSR